MTTATVTIAHCACRCGEHIPSYRTYAQGHDSKDWSAVVDHYGSAREAAIAHGVDPDQHDATIRSEVTAHYGSTKAMADSILGRQS